VVSKVPAEFWAEMKTNDLIANDYPFL